MRRFEREVVDYKLIEAMLQEMNIINVGMNDEDGFPYVVPMSFGFEMTDAHLNVYTHFMKVGKKVELLKKDPRVCIEFSIFNDFPDKKYKGHYHDYRSVIAKGKMKMLKDVTAKSEFPLRSVEDVPFLNVYEQEDDEVPFDISDIIADRKARRDK